MSDVTTYHWSRVPGKFVNKQTGEEVKFVIDGKDLGPIFTGNAREWYETLIETIIDVRNALHRRAFQEIGPCNQSEVHVFVSADTQCILECSVLYHPHVGPVHDDEPAMQFLGTLVGYNVHYDRVTSNDAVRVVATFKATDDRQTTLYGCVRVLDMPVLET